jgi:histidinol-phosphate phosphatase family protein
MEAPPLAVLFDRDGTLVVDVPYNGDPDRVRLVPGARAAVERVRAAGLRTGLVTNQSGIARGLLTRADADAVNARLAALVGGFDTVQVCPHAPDAGCGCRKPRPGMVLAAAAELGVPPQRVVVIGDIAADVEAAAAAGARGILVPTPVTRSEEVVAARETAPDLEAAVSLALPVPR